MRLPSAMLVLHLHLIVSHRHLCFFRCFNFRPTALFQLFRSLTYTTTMPTLRRIPIPPTHTPVATAATTPAAQASMSSPSGGRHRKHHNHRKGQCSILETLDSLPPDPPRSTRKRPSSSSNGSTVSSTLVEQNLSDKPSSGSKRKSPLLSAAGADGRLICTGNSSSLQAS